MVTLKGNNQLSNSINSAEQQDISPNKRLTHSRHSSYANHNPSSLFLEESVDNLNNDLADISI